MAHVCIVMLTIWQELSLDKLREMQGRTHEDPLREVAALQCLPSHPNVLTCTEVWRSSFDVHRTTVVAA